MNKTLHIVTLIIAVLLFQSTIVNAENPVEPVKKQRPKIGLVFSGGGAKGFAYIGMLRVFQEVGLHIDYIGGTSIGSIMGGLYAIGYSPDEIEKMIRAQDWNALLLDEIPRKYIAYEEKEFLEGSIISLPFKKRKIGLKQSLYKGQQVNLLLNRFFSPAWNITDFSKLQTPFFCIGTNLFNGNAEVLKTGYLPMAVRSSMSIPGYFSPTFYNGYYLVDGGIVDNYPAAQIRKEGAQYIIGGDVQSGLADSITQLNTMTEIIGQIVFFHGIKANEEAEKIIDLNIHYKVPAGMMDFAKYDTIIAYGEKVARDHYAELKALADSLNEIEFKPLKKYNTLPLDSLNIADVIYNGNNKMSLIYLNNYFGQFKNSKISIDDLEHVITRVYGTKFFEYVFYELKPIGNGKANLIINLEESPPGYLSASIHYDIDYQGSIRIDGIFRNILGHRSKLFTDLILGPNPRFRALYLLSNGAKPGFGVEFDMYAFKFNDYKKDLKINTLNFSNYKASAFMASTLNNLYSLRVGFEYEYFKFKQEILIDSTLTPFQNFNSYGNIFVKFRADTRNKTYFATTGFRSEFKVLYTMPLSKGWSEELFTNSFIFYLKYDHYINIKPKFTLQPGLFVGGTLKQDIPPAQHWFGVGGLNEINYVSNFVPFTGVYFIQKLGFYSAIARLKLQYNVYEKLYLTLRSDVGATESFVEDVFDPANTMVGYGLTASYNSFIGPVEFSVMGSNLNPSVAFFVSIGFNF
ncbi:MAG: patatin-like phospholipase family protein [Bacteroidetes bacterium]|nr:patatin-like phospholipase family protein [Bacteroidota bacterium]